MNVISPPSTPPLIEQARVKGMIKQVKRELKLLEVSIKKKQKTNILK